jgi:hypothetical protein
LPTNRRRRWGSEHLSALEVRRIDVGGLDLCEWRRTATVGQELGGYPGASKYEYWSTVDQQTLRRALNIGADADLAVADEARGEEIVAIGESHWLDNQPITDDVHTRMP